MASSKPAETASAGASASAATTAPSSPFAGAEAGRPTSWPAAAEIEAVKGFQCNCLMNARYHATREAFLDSVHRWLMFGVITFGAVSVVQLFNGMGWIKALFGAGAALFGALDLTFDLSNRARAHALMKRRYFELLADVAERKKDIVSAEGCMHRFSADEEPAYFALLAASWNAAQEMVYGDDRHEYDIPKLDLWLKNFWRFEGKQYSLNRVPQARPTAG